MCIRDRGGYAVTWAFGHLVQLAMPDGYGVRGFVRDPAEQELPCRYSEQHLYLFSVFCTVSSQLPEKPHFGDDLVQPVQFLLFCLMQS